MGQFSAFIPLDRRHALSAGRSLPDRVRGAALFADISGFTALTAALRGELGARRGAEEVVGHVNRVYTALIDEIHRYHGNVIGFSGDAVTCWFDEPDGRVPLDLSDSAARAVACALELQAVMTHLQAVTTPAGTVIPLAIKVASAAGPARRFLVGDPNAYVIEVLAGATLDRVAVAESLARRGEIVAAADTIKRVTPPPAVSAWREAGSERFGVVTDLLRPVAPSPRPPVPDIDDETARPWLLPPVFDHLQQGSEAFLAELRPSVALFAKFSGIDYDNDDNAGRKLDAFVRRVQTIAGRYEGYILQVTMGDKGSYLYVSFGAPIAHEKDAARAVAAALELQKLPTELDFLHPLQIGISRGLAHSGAYGSAQRRAFGVMGNEVNIAARLMSAAQPDQILISPRVAADVSAEFEAREMLPLALKGVAEPLAAREVRGRATRPAGLSSAGAAMVGREAERARLVEVLARLAGGESSALLVEGAAGIGKSLLIRELIEKAESDAPTAIVLLGSGDAVEQSTPYHAWRPVFERLLMPTVEGQTDERRRAAVLARLEPNQRDLAPLLNAVLPLNLPQTALTEQLSGEARQENTHLLLVSLLRSALAGAPLVLILDDAQWLDSVSWTLVERVQQEVSPLLLVVVARPMGDDEPAVYAGLRARPATGHIVLDTLPPAAVVGLIGLRLQARRLSPAVAAFINEKAEGHPFFSEEVAYALRDAGLLRVVDGEAQFAPGADAAALDFPTTIQGVVASRIDRLPPQQQLTVKVASVIGRIFAFRLLNDIYPVPDAESQLHENLRRLERLDITPQESPEPNLAYYFKQIVTQEVVYGLMTYAQRQQLHRHTALWYEKAGEGELERNYPLLAHHWQMAGDAPKAADYYEKAGESAFRDYANQEAIRFLTLAEELGGPDTTALRRARRRRLMGEANYRLTSIEASRADYDTALALLGRAVPGSTARRGLGLGGQLFRQVGHRLLPGRSVGRAAPEEQTALLEASRVYEGVSEVYYNLGDFLTTFYCTLTAFNLAETAGASPELMRGYANMCATLGAVSLNSAADGYRARALALEPQIDDLAARAWSRVSLSSHSVWVGAWDRAEREIGEALAIYAQLGDWRRWAVAAWLWPQVAQSRGELQRARDLWAELVEAARRGRDTRHQVRGLGGQFFNFLALDRPRDARECLSAVATALEENPEMTPVEERLWFAINAAWALREGEWARARETAHETLAAIGRARFKFDLLEVFATPAEVLLSLWQQGEATAEEARQGCKAINGYARAYAFARPRALRLRGRNAWLSGKQRQARKLWSQSLGKSIALGMPYERAMTLREMGHRLGDEELASQAEALFAALGVTPSTSS